MKLVKEHLPVLFIIIFTIALGIGCTNPVESPEGAPLKSGERIPLGNGNQAGPFAPGLQSSPVGKAFVFGHEEPDLFVVANLHSMDPGPGLYLYEWTGRNNEGVPVFAPPRKVRVSMIDPALRGVHDTSPSLIGSVFQTEDGEIHGWWLVGRDIFRTKLDREAMEFHHTPAGVMTLDGLPDAPETPANLEVKPYDNGTLQIVLSMSDGVIHRPPGFWRHPEYIMYNGAGVFIGKWPYEYLLISDTISPDVRTSVGTYPYSLTKREILQGYHNLTFVEYEKGGPKKLLTGSRYGNFLYYPHSSGDNPGKRIFVCDESGIVLRHKAIGPFPVSYTNAETGLYSDLIVGSESELIYYPFSGEFHDNGAPIYGEPFQPLRQDAPLYSGTLPVVNAVDWDDDGILDIVVGNSEGRVLLFMNEGTNEKPYFTTETAVTAGGTPIFIQPGYGGSVQGPAESRWGYSCPTFTDWNGDGLIDIMMHSAVSRHEVYLNIGEPGKPEFDFPVPLYCEGLDLHGTWRVQPGINKLDGRMAYVMLDDDNDFHIYWQIDAFNVEDGGKLLLEDGASIGGAYLSAGGTGRLKIVLEDWDLDGKVDMLVGTTRHSSVPDPINGLPQSKGRKGATVLFLKNTGSNSQPVFAYPVMMQFRGSTLHLGQHACSPEVWDYGQPGGPDLLLGEQDGKIRFYSRGELAWD